MYEEMTNTLYHKFAGDMKTPRIKIISFHINNSFVNDPLPLVIVGDFIHQMTWFMKNNCAKYDEKYSKLYLCLEISR